MPETSLTEFVEPLASLSHIAIREEPISYLWNKTVGKYHIQESIYIPKRFLSAIRVFFAIYFLISLFIILAYTENYYSLLQISRWGFVVQTIYYIQAASYSLKDKTSNSNSDAKEEENSYKMTALLYEIAFSFQLFNIIYFTYMIISKEIFELKGVELYIELQLHIMSFLVIWCEQLFSLMRVYIRHTLLIGLAAVINFAITYIAVTMGETEVYKGFTFNTWKDILFGFLMLSLPLVHFCVGCDHFDFKQKQKMIRRKFWRGQLVFKRKVRDNITDDN